MKNRKLETAAAAVTAAPVAAPVAAPAVISAKALAMAIVGNKKGEATRTSCP